MGTYIHIAAVALMREDGATLLVRKRGASVFMQPGGKIDQGELPLAALCRELCEELGLTVEPGRAEYLGRFSAPAAHEPGLTVIAEMFRIHTDATVGAQAEIEEIRWLHPAERGEIELAPLTRCHVLPLIWGAT